MRTILVALDGSSRAPGVLAAAVSVARAHEGRIVLLRAVGLPPEMPQDLFKTSDEPLLDLLQRQAAAYLETCLQQVPPELRMAKATQVPVGVAWDAVSHSAQELKADLIVIGSHGYGGLDRLLGTTAAKIVNHAPCSVLVVREPGAAQASGEHRHGKH